MKKAITILLTAALLAGCSRYQFVQTRADIVIHKNSVRLIKVGDSQSLPEDTVISNVILIHKVKLK